MGPGILGRKRLEMRKKKIKIKTHPEFSLRSEGCTAVTLSHPTRSRTGKSPLQERFPNRDVKTLIKSLTCSNAPSSFDLESDSKHTTIIR